MANPTNLLYSKEHEWVRIEGDTAVVGITQYAANALGEVVYVDLPKVGSSTVFMKNRGQRWPNRQPRGNQRRPIRRGLVVQGQVLGATRANGRSRLRRTNRRSLSPWQQNL
jgi:hypothetical protein